MTYTMTFSDALYALKSRHLVARKGWNGGGMWLVLVQSMPPFYLNAASPLRLFAEPSPMVTDVPEPIRVSLEPFIVMKTADDKFIPWLASQSDLLARDWEIIEE